MVDVVGVEDGRPPFAPRGEAEWNPEDGDGRHQQKANAEQLQLEAPARPQEVLEGHAPRQGGGGQQAERDQTAHHAEHERLDALLDQTERVILESIAEDLHLIAQRGDEQGDDDHDHHRPEHRQEGDRDEAGQSQPRSSGGERRGHRRSRRLHHGVREPSLVGKNHDANVALAACSGPEASV